MDEVVFTVPWLFAVDECKVFLKPIQGIDQCIYNRLSHWTFKVAVDGDMIGREYNFKNFQNFYIPFSCQLWKSTSDPLNITLWTKYGDGEWNSLALKTEQSLSHDVAENKQRSLFPRYNLNAKEPLLIDSFYRVHSFSSESGNGGSCYVETTSDVVVTVNGVINGDGQGFEREDDSSVYNRLKRIDALQLTLGGQQENWIPAEEESPDAVNHLPLGGGGIIHFWSSNDIVNNGLLSCNGSADERYSGGTICLSAAGKVENHGQIVCRSSGRVIFQCTQFFNDGMISPEPTVTITNGTEHDNIEMMLLPWNRNGGILEEIPLTVHRHRGHIYDTKGNECHPRNLLHKKGTDAIYSKVRMNRYLSNDQPAVGDWITFKIESPLVVIPKAVIIRNYDDARPWRAGGGLKSISLSLSVNGDEFEDFAVIQNVHRANKEEQYFNLKDTQLSNAKIWSRGYNYIKMEVLENWGRHRNEFHSFSLIGMTLKRHVDELSMK